MASAPPRAETTRRQSYLLGDTKFRGMDARVGYDSIDPGRASLIQNFICNQGMLTLRKGFQGVFTTGFTLGGALYEPTQVKFGTRDFIVFAAKESGSVGTVGRLWAHELGDDYASEILINGVTRFQFVSGGEGVRLAWDGQENLYILDSLATSGTNLWKTSWTTPYAAQTITSYSKPSDIAAVAGDPKQLDPLGDWNNFAADSDFSGNLISTGAAGTPWFDGATSGGTQLGQYWYIVKGSAKAYYTGDGGAFTNLPALGVSTYRWLLLSDPSVVVLATEQAGTGGPPRTFTTFNYQNKQTNNTYWYYNTDDYRWFRKWRLKFNMVKLGSAAQSFWVTVRCYNDAPDAGSYSDYTAPIYEFKYEVTVDTAHKVEYYLQDMELPDGVEACKYIRLYFQADTAGASSTDGPYITNVSFEGRTPASDYWYATTDGEFGYVFTKTPTDNTMEGLYIAGFPNPASTFANLTGYNKIGVRWRLNIPMSPTPIFEMMARVDGDNTQWKSGDYVMKPVTIIDTTSFPDDLRTTWDRVAFVFKNNPIANGKDSDRTPGATDTEIDLVDIVDVGNLTVDATYNWRITEILPAGTTYADGGLESPGSDLSVSYAVTEGGARVRLTLPARTNAAATHVCVWRIGGDLSTERLVAMFPYGTDTTGDNWSWDKTNRYFYDNVADVALVNQPIYGSGRDAAPTLCTAITLHGGRLWLGKGKEVFCSWRLQEDIDTYGLYFTLAPDPSDPEAYKKGASFSLLGVADTDGIVAFGKDAPDRIDTLGSTLIVYRRNGITTITGDSSANFAAQPSLAASGNGIVGPRAHALAGTRPWYHTQVGATQFNGNTVESRSFLLEPLLSSTYIANATGTNRIAYCWHDNRMWVFAPAVGGSTNSVVYVWDGRVSTDAQDGWHKFTSSVNAGFTGAVSIQVSGQVPDLYLAGVDGQLYKYANYSDKALDVSSGTAIPWAVTTRQYGKSAAAGPAFYGQNIVSQLDVDIDANASTTMTWAVTNERGLSTSGTYTLATGRKNWAIRGLRDVRGTLHSVSLSGSSSAYLEINGISIAATEAGVNRI